MAEKDDYLVDILVDLGFVTSDQVAQLRPEAQSAGVGLVDLMLANKLVRPADVTQAKAAHFGAEVVNLNDMKIPDEVIASIPRHIARKYRVVPVFKHDNMRFILRAAPFCRPNDLNRNIVQNIVVLRKTDKAWLGRNPLQFPAFEVPAISTST